MLLHLTLGLLLSLPASAVIAQNPSDIKSKSGNSGYIEDSRGNVARTPFGLCWRSGNWSQGDAIPGCDGPLTPPVAKPTAPAIQPPKPDQPTIPVAPLVPMAGPIATPQRCDTEITLTNDQTFAFDSARLTEPAQRRIRQEVLPKIAACQQLESILINGHTDPLGAAAYNQKLSERRANAVAAYLKTLGVGGAMETRGLGSTQTIQACAGNLSRKQRIECLSPNRRTVIQIRGQADQ